MKGFLVAKKKNENIFLPLRCMVFPCKSVFIQSNDTILNTNLNKIVCIND